MFQAILRLTLYHAFPCFWSFLALCFEANNEKWKQSESFLSTSVCFAQHLEVLYGHVSVFLWSCVVSCTSHGHWAANVGHKCCWCARLELCKTINTAGNRPRKTFDFGHNCFLLQLKLCCIPWQNWGIKACGECYQWLLFDELLLDQGLPAFGGVWALGMGELLCHCWCCLAQWRGWVISAFVRNSGSCPEPGTFLCFVRNVESFSLEAILIFLTIHHYQLELFIAL